MSLTIDALHGEQEARAIVEEDLSNANNIISNLNRQIEKLEGEKASALQESALRLDIIGQDKEEIRILNEKIDQMRVEYDTLALQRQSELEALNEALAGAAQKIDDLMNERNLLIEDKNILSKSVADAYRTHQSETKKMFYKNLKATRSVGTQLDCCVCAIRSMENYTHMPAIRKIRGKQIEDKTYKRYSFDVKTLTRQSNSSKSFVDRTTIRRVFSPPVLKNDDDALRIGFNHRGALSTAFNQDSDIRTLAALESGSLALESHPIEPSSGDTLNVPSTWLPVLPSDAAKNNGDAKNSYSHHTTTALDLVWPTDNSKRPSSVRDQSAGNEVEHIFSSVNTKIERQLSSGLEFDQLKILQPGLSLTPPAPPKTSSADALINEDTEGGELNGLPNLLGL